jgi:hypothetical protein
MDQEQILTLIEAMDQAGVIPTARRDALARGAERFGPRVVDRSEAGQWAAELRVTCPHFFAPAAGQSPAASGPTAAAGATVRSRRPQYRPLTAAAVQSLEGLSLPERMTKARELPQRAVG